MSKSLSQEEKQQWIDIIEIQKQGHGGQACNSAILQPMSRVRPAILQFADPHIPLLCLSAGVSRVRPAILQFADPHIPLLCLSAGVCRGSGLQGRGSGLQFGNLRGSRVRPARSRVRPAIRQFEVK